MTEPVVTRRVGFVGLGAMGSPMAANLARAGHHLTVSDIRREVASDLLAGGAVWADTPQEVAAASDVTFLSLPNPADVELVVTGPHGILAGAGGRGTVIDLSTNAPRVVRALAAKAHDRGVQFLDAPVSGGVGGARRGKLVVMVGGDRLCFDTHRPLLEVIGDKVFYVGEVGSGNVVKLINNTLFFVGLLGTVEALVLGTKAGVDPSVLRAVVGAGSGASFVFDYATRAILDDRLTPNFTVALAAKDIGLATALAGELGVTTPMGHRAEELIGRSLEGGFGDEDVLAIVKEVERQAGIQVRGWPHGPE